MKKKYYAVYKCPLCGTLMATPKAIELEYDDLPKLLGKIVRNQQFAGHPVLHEAPMHLPHKCADGNAGLAQFAGFIKA